MWGPPRAQLTSGHDTATLLNLETDWGREDRIVRRRDLRRRMWGELRRIQADDIRDTTWYNIKPVGVGDWEAWWHGCMR